MLRVLAVFLGLCVPLSRAQLPETITYNIGGIFETSEYKHIATFKKQIETMNFLLKEHFTESQRLFQLKSVIEIIDNKDQIEAHWAACKIISKQVIAIIGPKDSLASEQVQAVANRFGIPYIKLQWAYFDFDSQTTLNLHPSYNDFGKLLYDYLNHAKGWQERTNIVIFYNEEETLTKFDYLFNNHGRDVNYMVRKWRIGDENENKRIIKFFHQKKNFTKFIVDIPYSEIGNFLKITNNFGLNSIYHSYIFTDLDFRYLNPIVLNSSVSNITGFTLEEFTGSINITDKVKDDFSYMQDRYFSRTRLALIHDSIKLIARTIISLEGNITPPPIMSCSDNRQTSYWKSDFLTALYESNNSTRVDSIGEYLTDEVEFNRSSRSYFKIYILRVQKGEIISVAYWLKSKWSDPKENMKFLNLPAARLRAREFIKGRVLKVTTVEEKPYMLYKKNISETPWSTKPEDWQGMCIDMMNEISKRLGFAYEVYKQKESKFGMEDPETGLWNGMMGELINQEADIALGTITITAQRNRVVSFTTPYMELGVSILFRKPPKKPIELLRFLEPFSTTVWGYVLTAYIMVSFVLYMIARFTPYEWYNPHPCNQNSKVVENNFSMLNSMWFVIGSLMQQGIDIVPRATSTRIIAGCWWFFALIIISSYTANLAAFLTVERMSSPIESAQDLVKQTKIKYGTMKSGSTFNFFRDSKHETYKKMFEVMSKNQGVYSSGSEDGANRVRNSWDYAFILESTTNNYYVRRYCELMKIGPNLDSKGYGLALPKDSPYTQVISEEILKLLKEQKIIELEDRWFNVFNITEDCSDKSQKDSSSLGFEQMVGTFMMVFCALIFAFFIALCEFTYNVFKISKNSGRGFREEIAREFRFSMARSNKRNRRHEELTNLPPLNASGGCCPFQNVTEALAYGPCHTKPKLTVELEPLPFENIPLSPTPDILIEQTSPSISSNGFVQARIKRVPI